MAALRQRFLQRWGGILFGNDKIAIIHFLQGQGLLSVVKVCPQCNVNNMRLERDNRCNDGYRWKCSSRPCNKSLRLRDGTIFSSWSQISFTDIFLCIYLWANKVSMSKTKSIVGLTRKDPVIKLFQKLRQVCTNHLVAQPIRLGGGGINFVVQIDESQFQHAQRGGRGRRAQPVWVFGLVDTRFTPAKGYMEIVQRRNRPTLVGVINQVLNPNSVVHSDKWRAYNRLQQFVPNCIRHDTVNHTYHFIDPQTGAHTQHIESYWNRFKLKLKAMKGVELRFLESYMQEFMWRDWYGLERPFENIINRINIDFPQ